MKLFRHGTPGHERAGAVDQNGVKRDISLLVPDITPDWLAPEKLAAIGAIDLTKLPVVGDDIRFGMPVSGSRQFIAIGLNYRKHAAEANMQAPKEPLVFNKALTSLHGPNDDVVWPEGSEKMDWEVELGVIIGVKAQRVTHDTALKFVAGYCLANDVSEREWQIERGGTWDKGKGFDTFGPIGPWVVTRDEVADPQNLNLWLEVDGHRYQNGSTKTMVFGVAKLVSYLSTCMSLQPGDVISTGTPPGVGMGVKPNPTYLKPGQTIRLGIEGLGEQQQKTYAAE
jgi:ureidoglycolate lyase